MACAITKSIIVRSSTLLALAVITGCGLMLIVVSSQF